MGYTSGESVSFFQGEPSLQGWKRYRRVGLPTRLKLEHLLASSAIPTIFPAVRINREYFGDGALRQLAPISPALHLGAESDRKSTRLNSSHVAISYAVFCLKKKNYK